MEGSLSPQKKLKKVVDSSKEKSIMHFRCHERQRQKTKPSVLKSSLKISTDNLCGPSKRGLTKNEVMKVINMDS